MLSSKIEKLTDQETSVKFLKDLMAHFVKEREWEKFHTPKNLAISICLESSELLEHFQWELSNEASLSPIRLAEIGEEMADVLAYLLSLANSLNIDLSSTFQDKMRKNNVKYPADKFRGTWEKK
ncbi:nucleotide pyrophosphohydrolase [bacterium]|nr:nucleotide pyrophosphohydrolase [bacterium]